MVFRLILSRCRKFTFIAKAMVTRLRAGEGFALT